MKRLLAIGFLAVGGCLVNTGCSAAQLRGIANVMDQPVIPEGVIGKDLIEAQIAELEARLAETRGAEAPAPVPAPVAADTGTKWGDLVEMFIVSLIGTGPGYAGWRFFRKNMLNQKAPV